MCQNFQKEQAFGNSYGDKNSNLCTLVQDLTCNQCNQQTWMNWMWTLWTVCELLIVSFFKGLDLKYKHRNPFNQWWRLHFLFLFWWFIFTLWAQNQVLSFLECENFYGKKSIRNTSSSIENFSWNYFLKKCNFANLMGS